MNWKHLWRKHLGWFPIQFCMICGKAYWGGFPRFSREWVSDSDAVTFIAGVNTHKKWVPTWMPWWTDYCSRQCADEDMPPPQYKSQWEKEDESNQS